ncbi:MAG: hypothetical protein IKM79_03915 [Bacteroidales bacterium]|nr:hypothetical protein [Bacteroidales bacterium]
MGKIKASSLGMFRGKIGNVVTYITRGKNIVRIYTDTVGNPRTDKQQIVRARFSKLTKLGSDFTSALSIGFSYLAKQRRNFPGNNFITGNWEAVSASSPDEVTVNYAELKVAQGPLPEVTFGAVDWGSEEHLTIAVTFDGNVGTPRTDSDDEVYIFAYVPELGQGLLSSPAVRSAGEISLTVPAGWNGMTAHLWGFAVGKGSNNNGQVSDSAYVGHAEVQ